MCLTAQIFNRKTHLVVSQNPEVVQLLNERLVTAGWRQTITLIDSHVIMKTMNVLLTSRFLHDVTSLSLTVTSSL